MDTKLRDRIYDEMMAIVGSYSKRDVKADGQFKMEVSMPTSLLEEQLIQDDIVRTFVDQLMGQLPEMGSNFTLCGINKEYIDSIPSDEEYSCKTADGSAVAVIQHEATGALGPIETMITTYHVIIGAAKK